MRIAIGLHDQNQTQDWKRMIKWTRDYTTEKLSCDGLETVNLAEFVQFVTLKLSVKYLFKLDDNEWDSGNSQLHQDIVFAGKEINQLWMDSKVSAVCPIWADQHDLHQALRNVVGNEINKDPCKPTTNPMNEILPTYETMWRVVLRGLIEVLRPTKNSSNWQEAFIRFIDSAAQGRDRADQMNMFRDVNNNDTQISPLDVVKEILRLYPPTRRIYRQHEGGTKVQVDIEALHRSILLAPQDPQIFRPERWQTLIESWCLKDQKEVKQMTQKEVKHMEEKCGFMPFGLICPSNGGDVKGFGMKIIAILIGVLCNNLRDGWDLTTLEGLSEPLPLERNELLNISLHRTNGSIG
ncbi:hypothetical protein EJ08DRAFT_589908 [Tothia fuscella]|uniref:Uncharacterized protein n=1 Tax=Tothia fuscella TaxID=1048955 RepID=A0A9P4TX37_9PEZI|nr:hypothetical protein EJ08DRAFT_589908 [Tothia fuscella]